jgi:hypothetical protein
MGKCSNAFSETTNMIKAKLYMNVHWMVLYKLYVFCSDMKFKIFEHFPIGSNVNLWPAVVAILDFRSHKKHTLCRGPSNDHSWAVWFQLSKWFQRRKTWRFLFRYEFKMAATAGLSLTLDPMGKMFQNTSSLKLLGQLKPNLIQWVFLKNCVSNFQFNQ